jgi:hypothetical protein
VDKRISRRRLLKRSAGVTAGTAAAMAFLEVPSQAAAPGEARVGRVRRHRDGIVEVDLPAPGNTAVRDVVTVPVMGFPEGWQFRAGDQVLVTGPNFPEHPSTAWPLVTRVVGPVGRMGRSAVRVGGRRVLLRRGTVQAGPGKPGSRYQAYCVKNDRDQTLSCVALRPA